MLNGLIFDGFQARFDATYAKGQFEKITSLAATGLFTESQHLRQRVQFYQFSAKIKEESISIEKTLSIADNSSQEWISERLTQAIKQSAHHVAKKERKVVGNICLAIFLTGLSQIQQRVERLWKIVSDNYQVC